MSGQKEICSMHTKLRVWARMKRTQSITWAELKHMFPLLRQCFPLLLKMLPSIESLIRFVMKARTLTFTHRFRRVELEQTVTERLLSHYKVSTGSDYP